MIVNLGTYKLGDEIKFADCNDNSVENHHDKAKTWNSGDVMLNFFDFIANKNVIFKDGLLSDDLANRILSDSVWIGIHEDVDRVVFNHEVGNYDVIWDIHCHNGWYMKITIKNVYVESSTWTYELIVK